MNLPLFAIGVLRAHWKLIGLALLLAVIGVQQLRVTGLKSSLSAEKAGRLADRKEYERAQMEATAKAYAAKIKTEKAHEAEREKADLAAAHLGKQYRAIVLRYADAQRAGSGTNLPQPAEAAESTDRSGGYSVLPVGQLMIPQADALICADGIARLVSARDWALSLDKVE